MRHIHLRRANGALTFLLGAALTSLGAVAQAATSATTPAAGGANPATTEHMRELMKGSKFLGTQVVDAQNKELGEVKDMAVDIRNSRINYVVVSTGGIAGMGDKLRALPPQALNAVRKDDEVVLKVSPQMLNESPTLPGKDWIGAIDQRTLGTMYQRVGAGAPTGSASPQVLPASELLGRKVITDQEERADADIKDFAVDVRAGRVPFVIIALSPLAGPGGGKWVPVPTAALSKGELKDTVRIDSTAHDLANAQQVDKDEWVRVLADPSVAGKLYAAYRVTPYWTQAEGTGSTGNSNRPAAGASQTPSSEDIQRKGAAD